MEFYQIKDRERIVSSCSNISSKIDTLFDNTCLNNVTNTLSKNILQNLIYQTGKIEAGIDKCLRDIILRNCVEAEATSSGSGEISLLIINYFLKNGIKNKTRRERLDSIRDVRDEIIISSEIFSKHVRKATSSDIRKIIRNLKLSKELSKILREIIEKSEMGTDISTKLSSGLKSFYSENSGNRIEIDIDQMVHINGNRWERSMPDILLIDGVIEDVSQIHHVLEKSSKSKSSMVIVCRGASEEVKKTISLNYIRGTIDTILVEIGFDPEIHHFFEDMSALFGCSFVNLQMGDTISSKVDKLVFKLDSVNINSTSITFRRDKKDKKYVSDYIADVRDIKFNFDQTSDPESYEALSEIVDNRLKFLSSRVAEIKVGKEDLDSDPYVMSKIDGFLRSFSDISLTGIIDLRDIEVKNEIYRVILAASRTKIVTQRQVFQSLVTAFKTYETIAKAEKIFTIDY